MLARRHALLAITLVVASAAPAVGQTIPAAAANDNRTPAGILRDGVLSLHLEMRPAVWYPEEEGKAHLIVGAFAEEGHTPQIPGPMVRVPEGTEIAASIHNLLDHTIYVHGLNPRTETSSASPLPSGPTDPVFAADPPNAIEIPAGALREIRFRSGPPGSYYYWASNDRHSLVMRMGPDSMLSGAFIVDAPGAHPDDRVFVMNTWLPNGGNPFNTLPTINGKSWPYTEHLELRVGDRANWSWINTSDADHAMHMHGFYFQVNGVGDQDRFAAFKPTDSPMVVTQEVLPGGTLDMTWVPQRPGHWIMHCHFSIHMMMPETLPGYPTSSMYTPENAGMAGIVLGLNILPAAKPASAPDAAAKAQVHKFRLLVRERPATNRTFAGYSYDLAESGHPTPVNELPPVGNPLVLTRGEPAEIEVVNRLKEPTTVHWHGIELESYYDGVPGWSGTSRHRSSPIAPGGTFLARMTPPRAGTFIYHSHWHERKQLGGGLTGPIIVLPPGEKFDPATDKIFLFTRDGTDGTEPLLLNGISQPVPIPLTVGTRYRLRFINITPVDSVLSYSIVDSGGAPVQWRAIAKDGWDLPAEQTTPKNASEDYLSVGETRDYSFVPDKPGELYLRAVGYQRMWVTATLIVSPQ
jgi:FtsP/CotA-like multicopper oxidase with cupredoxin domain